AFKLVALVLHLAPLLGIGQRRLGPGDRLPLACQLGIERGEVLLVGGYILLGVDRRHRAFRHTDRAVDAVVGIDHQEGRPLAKRIDRANVHAIGVLAPDAGFGHHKGHGAHSRSAAADPFRGHAGWPDPEEDGKQPRMAFACCHDGMVRRSMSHLIPIWPITHILCASLGVSMRLAEYTDYTLRVLMYCAARPHQMVTISELAAYHGVSRNHLMKIVTDLGRQGLLETTRGRGGGLRLLKDPAQVRIGDVVRASETDFRLVECFDPGFNRCTLSPTCRLKGLLDTALQ